MFVFKAIAGSLLMPLPIAALLALVGLLALVLGRRRAGRTLMAVGALLALLMSLSPTGHALLAPLEGRYVAVPDAATLSPAPRFVAVLGGGYQEQPGWPVTAELSATSVVRLAEGLRLLRQLPDARLIASGGNINRRAGTARGYAEAAVALGFPNSAIIVNDTPLDTRAEIRAIRAEVANAPVLLVTSAAHMPRAMAYCREFGVRAVAAPTGYLTQPAGNWGVSSLVPSSASVQKSEIALHEYLGLLSQRAGGP